MTALDLRQAVQLAIGREETGYRWLYREYAGRISHLLKVGFRMPQDLSEDLLQETFMDAFCSLHTLRDPERFGAWLNMIARHKAIRRLKKDKKISEWLDQYIQEVTITKEPNIQQAERLAQLVKQVIDELPEGPLKECALLYYWEGNHTVDDVAKKQKTTRGTITTRLKRFRRRIKKKLIRELEEIDYEQA